ncbi:protein involved in plasmid replication-relaxation [Asanoa ferruginea]|uniref:Protein involved in plasmid replication-relaxation n=1 Tax=Asanoa ferruginea TaxID=53367 RepID=A0A3D9ZJU7_9ACTN|nr:replication-relaxation family protein [Asanoa ferruginea]REF96193.1 protein involved in plasmid replication-relaxation [Asanoa ferruginea]GIF49344.1 hypothetical protein Afe04nite_38830 [Asanoa ferruginea]
MARRDDLRLLQIQSTLTHRDLRLLGWLYDHGVLTSDQICIALFPSKDFGQRRLLRLTRLEVIGRFRPQRWGGGSYPYHYLLDQLGTDVVAAQRGHDLPRRSIARQRRHHLTSRANLPHLLGTNQVFVELASHQRQHPGTSLDRWLPSSAFHQPSAFLTAGGSPSIITRATPRPDGHGVWAEGGRSVPFFLEYDTGTENLTVLTDKITRYDSLAAEPNWRWPVLFLLPSTRRELNLHRHIATTGPPRFAVVATTAADFLAATGLDPAEQVWWVYGTDSGRVRLIELPHNAAPSVFHLEPIP